MRKLLFLGILILFYCCENNNHLKSQKTIQNTPPVLDSIPQVKETDIIHELVTEIENANYIEDKNVGFVGKPSELYDCFERLCRLASDSLLQELSYSKNPVMRYYAYRGLLRKASSMCPKVKLRLLADTTGVCWVSGDIGRRYPLRRLVSKIQ